MKILGIAGFSGSGKTTLLERVVPRLVERGLVVSLAKHAHHGFEIDRPGKDSHRHRAAGCREVLVSSSARWALVRELRGAPEPPLSEHLARLSPCDLVLVEGWKREAIDKLEVHRPSTGHPLLQPGDRRIVAVASDERLDLPVPVLDLNDAAAVAAFVAAHCGFAG